MQVSAADRRRRKLRALEWRRFRQEFLYSQEALAETLPCARRTVVSIETEAVTKPNYNTLKKFADLKRRHESERREFDLSRAGLFRQQQQRVS